MDRTTLNRNLEPLEKKGFVRSLPVPDDARARMLTLTTDGHAALAGAAPAWRKAQAQLSKRYRAGPSSDRPSTRSADLASSSDRLQPELLGASTRKGEKP